MSHKEVGGTTGNSLPLAPPLVCTVLLAFCFAWVEISIEGGAGWAAGLPTWRIEQHWLLDVFWGSRPMTGYHAWVFPFIFLFFHFPLAFFARWTLQLEMRVLACVALFWLVEDFMWFVLNPAFGIARFAPDYIPWHKNWIGFAPLEYWIFAPVCVLLFWRSEHARRKRSNMPHSRTNTRWITGRSQQLDPQKEKFGGDQQKEQPQKGEQQD